MREEVLQLTKRRFLHRNETSLVSLRLLDGGVRVQEAIYGRNYTLRAEISRPDGSYFISVVCFYASSRCGRKSVSRFPARSFPSAALFC